MASNGISRRRSVPNNNEHKPSSSSRSPAQACTNQVMSTDENSTVTPEQNQNTYTARATALSNAPRKRNSQGPFPLVKTKLEKSDGDDTDREKPKAMVVKACYSKSSTINPITHTKILEKHPLEKKSVPDISYKGAAPATTNELSNGKLGGRFITTVTLPKGVEMKRTNKVAGPSVPLAAGAGTKPKATTKSAESSKGKPTRTTVTAHYVPTKVPIPISKSLGTLKTKSTDESSKPVVANGASSVASAEIKLPDNTDTSNADEAMPEPSADKPTKYYKSKFWSYVDPNRKPEPAKPKPERDADRTKEVREYMEKRREMFQLQLKKKEEEREQALEKRRTLLEELKIKSRGLVSSKSQTRTPPSCSVVSTDKQTVKQFRNKQSLSPLKARRAVLGKSPKSVQNETADADAVEAKRNDVIDPKTSTLLREFEHIVQQECMNILRIHRPLKSPRKAEEPATMLPSKADAAVETTISLFERDYNESLPDLPTSSERRTTMFKTLIHEKPPGTDDVKNKAAARIQAAYKGYKVRKILQEANLLPKMRKQNRIMKRVWPFPTLAGKPQSAEATQPTATRSSTDWDFAYIPPPEQASFGSPRAKGGLPVTSLSHIELSRFHEPFPKEALRRLSAIHNSPKPKSFYERRYSDSAFKIPVNLRRNSSDTGGTDSPLTKPLEDMDVAIPRFSTVLKEKVRLLEEKTTLMIRSQDRKSPGRRKHPRENRQSEPVEAFQNSIDTSGKLDSEALVSNTNTITEEYIGPDEKKMKEAYGVRTASRPLDPGSPRRPKHSNRRKKLALSFVPETKSGSTTTVDTDEDLQSEPRDSCQHEQRPAATDSVSKDGIVTSSSLDVGNYPTPAVQLQFQAEKERLHILEEALKTTLAAEARNNEERNRKYEAQRPEEELEVTPSKLNNTSNLNGSYDYMIELTKCQAESLKATAEVTKWMTELRKAEKERELVQRDQQTVNMAAVVFAAVEEAKRMSGISTQVQQKQEVAYHGPNADEYTQFPSERSELPQTLDEHENVEQNLTKLDTTSTTTTSEAVTFMTEKSTIDGIDAKNPNVFVEASLPQGTLDHENHDEITFEKRLDDLESLVESEDLQLSNYHPEESSIPVIESEHEQEHELKNEESLGELREIMELNDQNRLGMKEFESEIRRITANLTPNTPQREFGTLDNHIISPADGELYAVGDSFISTTEVEESRLRMRDNGQAETHQLRPTLQDLSSKDNEPAKGSATLEEIPATQSHVEAKMEENENVNMNDLEIMVPVEPTPLTETEIQVENAEGKLSSSLINEQEHRTEESTRDSGRLDKPWLGSKKHEPETETAAKLYSSSEKIISREVQHEYTTPEKTPKSSTSQSLAAESDAVLGVKIHELGEPFVHEPESPVNPPDEISEASVVIEEIKETSWDSSSHSITESEHITKAQVHDEEDRDENKENENFVDSSLIEPEGPQAVQEKISPLSPAKPPPPYSSPTSKSIISTQEDKNQCKESQVREMINQHIEFIWDSWVSSKKFPPGYEQFSSKFPRGPDEAEQLDSEHPYELLISDTICEVIQEIFDVALNPALEKSYADQIRLGPLAMQAQKLRLPQTKEKLFQLIYEEVLCLIPPGVVIYSDGAVPQPEKRCTKWSCKERDLADEVLAQELVKEDRTWLNCWPEEVIVQQRLTDTLIKRLISQVVHSFEVALK